MTRHLDEDPITKDELMLAVIRSHNLAIGSGQFDPIECLCLGMAMAILQKHCPAVIKVDAEY